MTLPVPNETLDLHTLKFVREGVLREKELASGIFHVTRIKRVFFGLFKRKVKLHCAVGTVYPLHTAFGGAYGGWCEQNDLDPDTLSTIMQVNDDCPVATDAGRRNAMLDWLDRCIAYTENVTREIERLGSSNAGNVVKSAA